MQLAGKAAVVTGASGFLAEEIALTLARSGADVLLGGRGAAVIAERAQALRTLGRRAEAVATDPTDPDQVAAMVTRALAFFGGRIDILVNCAGQSGPLETPIWEISADDFDALYRVNVRGVFLPMRHVMPIMVRQRAGKVVNIGGLAGMMAYKLRAGYSATKWALRGLTRTAAIDAGPYGVNVNLVHPGMVHSPRMEKACATKARLRGVSREEIYQEYVDLTATKRITRTEDVAKAVLFLCSPASDQMTGQELMVDGGQVV